MNPMEIAQSFWRLFNERQWDQAKALLSDEFEAIWPQSKEEIVGRENYIRLNSEYPGTHKIAILKSYSLRSQSDTIAEVVTEVAIRSTYPDAQTKDLFAVSFFTIHDDKIAGLREYWADTYPAPEWRKHLVKHLS